MNKIVTLGLSAALLLSLLAGCGSSSNVGNTVSATTEGTQSETSSIQSGQEAQSAAAEPDKVLRIATQTYPLYASINLANELGFIDEELENAGYKAEWTDYASGPLVNEAVAAGEADVGHMADLPAIIARSSGQPIQVVSGVATGEKSLAVLIPTDSDIQTIEDLKGKKIAYATGSYAQHLLALVLDQAGLTFDDVESINLGAADSPTALETGEVDAIVIWEQFITKLTEEGKAKVLIDGTGIKKSNMVLYAVSEYAAANPDAIVAFIKGTERGAQYIKDNPEDAAKVLAPIYSVTEDVIAKILQNFDFTVALSDDDITEILTVASYANEAGIIQNPVGEEFIDTTYLKQAGY